MNRLDRALGILLLLRRGDTLSAAELSRRFEVSTRTIYRDMETLSAIGVPIYAEMGRAGGFRLVPGFFLPPVMFSVGEAVSLLLGLTLLRSLRSKPFAAELETSADKLLAAVPDHLRAILTEAQKVIGFEAMPSDAFHPEPPVSSTPSAASEDTVVGTFLQALLDRRLVMLDYRSPYRATSHTSSIIPCGLLWDRNRWYLVGKRAGQAEEARLWRADRVAAIRRDEAIAAQPLFDVRALLGRNWLRSAMQQWAREAPVTLRLSRQQAERLQQDWYYRQAQFEDIAESQVRMTFGESDRAIVLELLRWLGPGAELIEPRAWRQALRDELREMLAVYADS
jgi:predicted DNA-binding transcriptional regulator YafY